MIPAQKAALKNNFIVNYAQKNFFQFKHINSMSDPKNINRTEKNLFRIRSAMMIRVTHHPVQNFRLSEIKRKINAFFVQLLIQNNI